MSGAIFTCTKCGVTGHGKAIQNRSIFLDKEMVAMYEMILRMHQETQDNGLTVVKMRMVVDPDKSLADNVRLLGKEIAHMEELGITDYVCCQHSFKADRPLEAG